MKKLLTGNGAVSFGAQLAKVEVIAAYPITPQTEIVEKLSEMVSDGSLKAKFINVESEHSAMAACIGASSAGARAFTATSSQGLALMHELLHWASGARLPIVMANVNRAMAPPWNVWCDQTDSLSQRDTGWMQFYCQDNQEVLDTVLQAYKVSESLLLPSMIMLDAFILSHTSEQVEIPKEAEVNKFLPPFSPKHKLDVTNPCAFGGLTGPDLYYEFRYNIQSTMNKAIHKIKEVDAEFEKIFKRSYGLVETYKLNDAKTVLVTSGSLSSTAKIAVDNLRKNNKKVGLLRIRVFRPFPKDEICKYLKDAEIIGVIDRNISFGNEGIFFTETKAALYNTKNHPPVYGFIAGLGGRDITVSDIEKIAHILEGQPKELNWIGVKF